MRRRRYLEGVNLAILVICLVIMLWAAHEGWAAEVKYPTRPIQIVVAYQPGSTDVSVRPFTEKLPDYLGQPVAFVYKPGASGAVGASFVSKARADGYTLFATPPAPIITTPLTQEGLDYTLEDFAPIARLVRSPIVLATKADSPLRTLKDMIQEAKKSPGKITFSSAGTFSTTQIPVEMFAKLARITLTHVPCPGANPAVTALLGGHVALAISSMAALSPHLKAKSLRALAVFEKERLKEFPDAPTFSELGYPVIYFQWHGILAPKKTPEAITKQLYFSLKKVLDENRKFIEDRLANISLQVDFLGLEEFAAFLKEQNETAKKIVKELQTTGK